MEKGETQGGCRGENDPLEACLELDASVSLAKEKNLLFALIRGGRAKELVQRTVGMLQERRQGGVLWRWKKFGVSVRTSGARRIIHEFNQSSEG